MPGSAPRVFYTSQRNAHLLFNISFLFSCFPVLCSDGINFFDDIVHDQICIDLGLVRHVLFVGLTQLTNLINVEALIGVHFKHPVNQASQLLTISVRWRWEITLTDSLK